jgi:hypothetical protein
MQGLRIADVVRRAKLQRVRADKAKERPKQTGTRSRRPGDCPRVMQA